MGWKDTFGAVCAGVALLSRLYMHNTDILHGSIVEWLLYPVDLHNVAILVNDTLPLLLIRRKVDRSLPRMESNFLALEEPIDLLQRQIPRLRIEEVDQWQEEGVEDGKVNIRSPADVSDAHRCNLDDEEGEDPIRGRREGRRTCANGKGSIVRWQEPGNGQETDGEEEVEEEEHHDGDDAGALAAVRYGAGKNGHAARLAGGGEDHEFAAAEAIEDPDGR